MRRAALLFIEIVATLTCVAWATPVANAEEQPKIVSGTAIIITTESGVGNLFSDEPTVGQASAIVGAGCGTYAEARGFLVSAVGKVVDLTTLGIGRPFFESGNQPQLVGTPAGSNCQITLRAPVRPSDAGGGTLILTKPGVPDLTAGYSIQRSNPARVFALPLLLSAVTALTVGLGARPRDGSELDPDFKYSDGWSSSFGVLGTGLATLLAATGLLGQFLPQYQVGGLLSANLVAAFFILLAPATFLGLKRFGLPRVRGLRAAAVLTMTGVFYQISLVGVLLGNAGQGETATNLTLGTIAVAIFVVGSVALFTVRNSTVDPTASNKDWDAEPDAKPGPVSGQLEEST